MKAVESAQKQANSRDYQMDTWIFRKSKYQPKCKIMGKYKTLYFPFNFFKAHDSLKAKIIIFCGIYIAYILIHMTNRTKGHGDTWTYTIARGLCAT